MHSGFGMDKASERLIDSAVEKAVRVIVVAASPHMPGGQAVQAKGLVDGFTGDSVIDVGFVPTNLPLEGKLSIFQSVRYLRTILNSFKFWLTLVKEIPSSDVVHVFSGAGTSYIISTLPPLFLAKLFRKKVILNYHSGQADEHFRRWRFVVKLTLKMFDAIVVPSEFLVGIFSNYGFEARTIHNFVDEELFAFRARKNISPIFLSIRNLEPEYNVACLMRAFALIQAEIPYARLLIAGEGSERAKLEALAAELNLCETEFLGAVSREKASELLHEADIYLNSSDVDNMPLSIMEAFASGAAVVTTDSGGIPFMVRDGETGFLVPRGDEKALAERSLRLLRDPDLTRRIAANAREVSIENYSWTGIRRQWIRVYKEVYDESR
jgi:glycosyltransferase involved in cell wall biosynthesis